MVQDDNDSSQLAVLSLRLIRGGINMESTGATEPVQTLEEVVPWGKVPRHNQKQPPVSPLAVLDRRNYLERVALLS